MTATDTTAATPTRATAIPTNDVGVCRACLRRCAIVAALIVSAWFPAPSRAEVAAVENAQRLDGLAAVVGALTPGPRTVVILRSDVELRARLGLLRASNVARALGPLPEGLLAASLRELVGEALIAVEAARLSFASPLPAALVEERTRLVGTGDAARECVELLAALGVVERELARWVARRAAVRGFLQANLEGTLEVSDAELERSFTSDPHPFAGLALEAVRTRYAAWLAQQRMRTAVEGWVQSLTQRTPHRVLVSYRESPPEH